MISSLHFIDPTHLHAPFKLQAEDADCPKWDHFTVRLPMKEAANLNTDFREHKLDTTDGIKFEQGAVFDWLELDYLDVPLFHITIHGILHKALKMVEQALKDADQQDKTHRFRAFTEKVYDEYNIQVKKHNT